MTYTSRLGAVVVVDRLATVIVVPQPSSHQMLVKHVAAQQHLSGIIVDQCVAQLHWFPIAHIDRADDHHPGEVGEDHAQCGQWVLHEGILFCAGIWKWKLRIEWIKNCVRMVSIAKCILKCMVNDSHIIHQVFFCVSIVLLIAWSHRISYRVFFLMTQYSESCFVWLWFWNSQWIFLCLHMCFCESQ